MYYILTNKAENDDKDAILEGDSIYLDRIECSFEEGLPLPSEDIDTPIIFELYEFTLRGKMTDHLSIDDIPGPVFSFKSKTVFDKLGITNVEYYKLTLQDIIYSDNEWDNNKIKHIIEYNHYFIANVVGLVDCVDHEKSELEYFLPPELRTSKEVARPIDEDIFKGPFADENPNKIDFITRLVLDYSKIDHSLKIFRLLDQPDLLVFHKNIVDQIISSNLSGFVFEPVSEYTDAIPDDEDD